MQPENKKTNLVKKILILFKGLMILAISILVGTFLFTFTKDFLIFSAQSVLAVWLVAFIFALITKANYNSRTFLFNLVLATFLVSFYPFGQGLMIVLTLLILQKTFKIL